MNINLKLTQNNTINPKIFLFHLQFFIYFQTIQKKNLIKIIICFQNLRKINSKDLLSFKFLFELRWAKSGKLLKKLLLQQIFSSLRFLKREEKYKESFLLTLSKDFSRKKDDLLILLFQNHLSSSTIMSIIFSEIKLIFSEFFRK